MDQKREVWFHCLVFSSISHLFLEAMFFRIKWILTMSNFTLVLLVLRLLKENWIVPLDLIAFHISLVIRNTLKNLPLLSNVSLTDGNFIFSLLGKLISLNRPEIWLYLLILPYIDVTAFNLINFFLKFSIKFIHIVSTCTTELKLIK